MYLTPFSNTETNSPFSTLEIWSKEKNVRTFVDTVRRMAGQSTHYSANFFPFDYDESGNLITSTIESIFEDQECLIGTAQHVAAFIENYDREWGTKAIAVLRKINCRVQLLKCHVSPQRFVEIEASVDRIKDVITQIQANTNLDASEVFPQLPCSTMDIIMEYDDSRSLKELSMLAAKGIISANMKHPLKLDAFHAAFCSSTDDKVCMFTLELLVRKRKYDPYQVHEIMKRLNNGYATQRLVTKFYEEHAPKMAIDCLYVPKKFNLSKLEKFRATSFESADVHVAHKMIQLKNTDSITSANPKASRKFLRNLFLNQRWRYLKVHCRHLDDKLLAGALNPNLVALQIFSYKVGKDVLTRMAKSFPNLKALHIALVIPNKQVKEISQCFAKFTSLETLVIVYFNIPKDLVKEIAALSLPTLKNLCICKPNPLGESPIVVFPKERFPNLVEYRSEWLYGLSEYFFFEKLEEMNKSIKESYFEKNESKEKKYEYDSKEDLELMSLDALPYDGNLD